MASPETTQPCSPTPSHRPASPVYSIASTANPLSHFSLPLPPAPAPAHAVLSKADLDRSQLAYSELVQSAKDYRRALAALSTAASSFGSALESCARLKEARAEPIGPISSTPAAMANVTASFAAGRGACTADTLLSASGVHHLIANHQQILSETVYRSFEVPLLHEFDKWQGVIDEEEATYQQKTRAQAKEVKRLEKEGMKLHKQRRRDVARFRAHLVDLTTKLDGLTTLHTDHARTLLRESQETSARIVDASCSLVRAEVDIFEGLARKGWSGGGLDDLLEKGQDLFASEDHATLAEASGQSTAAGTAETAKLFSILPPRSILADTASDPTRVGGHVRHGSLLADTERYQSLTGVAATGDAESAMSADFNKPRNARPFSPQPIRRIATDVTCDSLGVTSPMEAKRMDYIGEDVEGQGERDEQEEDGRETGGRETYGREAEEEEPERDEPPRGRRSPEFVTDESSPESMWGTTR